MSTHRWGCWRWGPLDDDDDGGGGNGDGDGVAALEAFERRPEGGAGVPSSLPINDDDEGSNKACDENSNRNPTRYIIE